MDIIIELVNDQFNDKPELHKQITLRHYAKSELLLSEAEANSWNPPAEEKGYGQVRTICRDTCF